MGKRKDNPDSLLTLPVVLGVIVVLGGIAATIVSGLFVWRAHTVNAETQRMQALLQAERDEEELEPIAREQEEVELPADEAPHLTSLPPDIPESSDTNSEGYTVTTLKPGVRLRAQRPAHWDQVEIIDILEDHKIKVRWLSGEPGEDIIAAELVSGDNPPTQ